MYRWIAYSLSNISTKKLSKSVDERRSYRVQHQCRFGTQCSIGGGSTVPRCRAMKRDTATSSVVMGLQCGSVCGWCGWLRRTPDYDQCISLKDHRSVAERCLLMSMQPNRERFVLPLLKVVSFSGLHVE